MEMTMRCLAFAFLCLAASGCVSRTQRFIFVASQSGTNNLQCIYISIPVDKHGTSEEFTASPETSVDLKLPIK